MSRLHLGLLSVVALVFGWSAIGPKDFPTWALEVFPVVLASPILALTYHRFRLTDLVYCLIAAHAVVLVVGGHYTYAEVPLGDWVREAFGQERNHYDRLGHLMQGFVPALIAREVFIRLEVVRGDAWRFFTICCVCLAISASYEFLEWWTALVSEQGAAAFLGTQGDHWDTQWDMFLALCGAVAAQLLLGRWHDRQLAQLRAG
jgi:putative membrane protein